MPIPGGHITTSTIWTTPAVEEAVEIVKEEDAELLDKLAEGPKDDL